MAVVITIAEPTTDCRVVPERPRGGGGDGTVTIENVTDEDLYDVPELPAAPDRDGPAYGPPLGIEDPFPESADPSDTGRGAAWPEDPTEGGRVRNRFRSPLPEGCRLTSPFGQRNDRLHAGTDYGPPEPGQTGIPVFAVAEGTVLAVDRGRGRKDDRIPYHSGRFVWLDLGFHGGQRMRAYYGHLASVDVAVGQVVQAGQALGRMGGSGAQGESDYAVHLHFGVSQDHDRPVVPAGRFGAPGWINGHTWLRSKGVTVGVTKPAPVEPDPREPTRDTKDAKGTTTVQTAQANGAGTDHVRDAASIRAICIRAGHGDASTTLGLLIERYQHRQQEPLTLEHDRHWGAVTERHYQWVLVLQRALNRWKGADLAVDGDYGRTTAARVREVQERNLTGAYRKAGGTVADGDPGPATARMLGIAAYPG